MTQYARIESGVVAELFDTDADIATLFHPSLKWVSCEGVQGIESGWDYSKGKFSAPKQAAKSNEQMRAEIAARRYMAETSGIEVNGVAVDTGRDSQALITGAALAASLDPAYTCNWKAGNAFVRLDAQTLLSVASAVRAHVQAAFDRESDLLAMVEKGTYTEAALEEGWP